MPIRSTRCRIDVALYPRDQKTFMARSRTTSGVNSLGRATPHRVSVSERSVKKTWYGPERSISFEEGSMTLGEKLDAMREASKARIPPEARAIMQRSIDDLRASGIMHRVVRVGQTAPDFTLPNADGRPISLKELLVRRPL